MIQVMLANRDFVVDAKCINFTSDKVKLTSTSSFDQFVTIESTDLAYVNLSSSQVLSLIDIDCLPDQFSMPRDKIIAYRGFKVKSSFKGFFNQSVIMEKVKEKATPGDLKDFGRENEEPYQRRSSSFVNSAPCIKDSFLILESDSQLIVKRLAHGETLKAKHYTVLISDIREEVGVNNTQLDDLGFKEYKGPGVLFIDPLKGKSQIIHDGGGRYRARTTYGRPIRARAMTGCFCISILFLIMIYINLLMFKYIR